jgi:dTDP-4-dehydrorhamnose 3,5-epimerase-like enzyme
MPDYFKHSQAIVETKHIGDGTRIWAFVHILPGAAIGEECNICDHVFIENDVRIGNRVTIKSGVQLWDGVTLEDDVFIGPIATFNPARITGYGNTSAPLAPQRIAGDEPRALAVSGAKLHRLPLIEDLRGALTFGEIDLHLPFQPKRFFVVFDVPSREVRGEHAHRQLHEFLVCLRGSCAVALDDASSRDEVVLDKPTIGLHVPPKLWRVHYKYSPDAILLALCSDKYDASDYIRDYDEFLALAKSGLPFSDKDQ